MAHGELVADPAKAKLEAAIVQSDADFDGRVADEHGDVDDEVEQCAAAIDTARQKGVEAVLEIGRQLDRAHQLLAGQGREGQFRPWVQQRCGFSKASAYNYLSAYRAFGKCPTVGHFDVAALYLAARETTPQEVRDEAIELSRQGEHVTPKRVHKLLADDRPEEPKAAPKGSVGEPDPNYRNTEAFAMSTADVAITQLAAIKPSNPARGKAFSKVESWIQQHNDAASQDPFATCRSTLSQFRRELKALLAAPTGYTVNGFAIRAALRSISKELKEEPTQPCPYCLGKGGTCCNYTGVVSQRILDNA